MPPPAKMKQNDTAHPTTKGLMARLIECNRYEASQFVDFLIEDIVVGKVHRSRLDLLKKEPAVFHVLPDQIILHPCLETPETRTQALSEILHKWRRAKIKTLMHNITGKKTGTI